MVDTSGDEPNGQIPDDYVDLFDRKSIATLTTFLPNEMLHVTVVWIDYDGTHLLINSGRDRRKVKNLRQNPSLGLAVIDPETFYRYLWIAGTVEKITKDGAVEHANSLAQRYLDTEKFPHLDAAQTRVIIKVDPKICHGYTSQVLEEFDV